MMLQEPSKWLSWFQELEVVDNCLWTWVGYVIYYVTLLLLWRFFFESLLSSFFVANDTTSNTGVWVLWNIIIFFLFPTRCPVSVLGHQLIRICANCCVRLIKWRCVLYQNFFHFQVSMLRPLVKGGGILSILPQSRVTNMIIVLNLRSLEHDSCVEPNLHDDMELYN